MLPQQIFIGWVSVRQYSWSKNELKMFIEKTSIPVLAPLINNVKNKILAKMVGLTLCVVDCWPLLLQTIFYLKIQEKNITFTANQCSSDEGAPKQNLKRKIQYFEKLVVLCKWTEVNRYCLKGETINHFVKKLSIRNSEVAHVAPFFNQWKTSTTSSYQWRLLFLWIYFCTTNTPAFRQSDPFCVFEVKILLVCPEALKKKANGKNYSLARYTFEWQKSKTRELLNIIFSTFSWWEKKRD